MGLFGSSDDKKRQPAGSANGGQFAPDTSGKTPPESDPLRIVRYTPNGGAMERSASGVDAAHAAYQASLSEDERLIALTDDELHTRAVTAAARGAQTFAAEMVELRKIAKLKADDEYDRSKNFEDDTNTWRPYRIPMNDIDLSGMQLEGVDFSNAELHRAKFDNATLTNCKFDNAVLVSSSFVGTTLTSGNFYGAQLSKSDFTTCFGDGVSFERTGMNEVKFHGSQLRYCDFRSASLREALMESVTLTGSNLDGARMAGARIVPARYADTNGTPNWS